MNQGKNLYSPRDLSPDAVPDDPRVFISHRNVDKPAARAIAKLLTTLDVHVWLDEEDQDLQLAAAKGLIGEQGVVHAIERGVRHSSNLLGFLSRNTVGSWWVPFEIGYSRASDKSASFVVSEENDQTVKLPEYISGSPTFRSVDELARWAAMLSGNGLHSDLTAVPVDVWRQLETHIPPDPPAPDIVAVCEDAIRSMSLLAETETQTALELTSRKFDWIPTSGGIIRDIAYDLLAPLTVARFGIASDSKHLALEQAYLVPTLHYELAKFAPEIEYCPEVPGWKSQRYRTPRVSWVQGLRKDQLDTRLERFMTARDRLGALRVATKAEFRAEFDRVLRSGTQPDRRALGVLINPMLGFSMETRPVFWRALSVQYHLYSSIIGRDLGAGPFGEVERVLGERFAASR